MPLDYDHICMPCYIKAKKQNEARMLELQLQNRDDYSYLKEWRELKERNKILNACIKGTFRKQ